MTDRPRHDHSAFRELVEEAALEAEFATGRREKTPEQAKRSVAVRLARLAAGWVLVLLGLAGLVLPGPGWLIVILGLSLLPYAWAERTIRIIRRRIPGIPEDGRIPTSTWVIMGLAVALSTGVSVWWGTRDRGDEGTDRAAAATTAAPRPPSPRLVVASLEAPDRTQLAKVYGEVAATSVDARATHRSSTDPCGDLTAGRADLVVVTPDEAATCFGTTDEAGIRAGAAERALKVFGPVAVNGVSYWPIAAERRVPRDDEPAERAIDGVSEVITDGASLDGDPADRAEALLRDAGVG